MDFMNPVTMRAEQVWSNSMKEYCAGRKEQNYG
jgi:hypothetical protein